MSEEIKENLDSSKEEQEGAVELETLEGEELTPEKIAELKQRAEASSQNYERAKKAENAKKELEKEIEILKAQRSDDDLDGETDSKIAELRIELREIKEQGQMDKLLESYPVLRDKRQEFDDFREEYPGISVDKVAKLFISEKELDTKTSKRKGLEVAKGGQRVAPQSGKMSSTDVKRLRETNFKEYMKLIKNGKVEIAD